MTADGSINLNPLSLVDRLIREHGSASILRDHLGLLREQISILQTKNTELETQNGQLQDALADHKREIDVLTEQVNQVRSNTADRRSEEEEKMLVHVATHDGLSSLSLIHI